MGIPCWAYALTQATRYCASACMVAGSFLIEPPSTVTSAGPLVTSVSWPPVCQYAPGADVTSTGVAPAAPAPPPAPAAPDVPAAPDAPAAPSSALVPEGQQSPLQSMRPGPHR